MIIIGIDVGVKNLGISSMEWSDDFEEYSLRLCQVVDITTFPHKDSGTCNLYHDNTYSDFLDHVFHYYEDEFQVADKILIERQPPGGYVVVEQLIFHQFRQKSVLIHPCSVHKYFSWCSDYDLRKGQSVNTAMKYVGDAGNVLNSLTRAHDVADSICFILYYGFSIRDEIRVVNQSKAALSVQFTDEFTVGDFLNSFAYKLKT